MSPLNNISPDIIDFKREVLNELDNHSYDSLRIYKMFQSKKSNLPNNQRIQNLSWRVSSLSNSKRQHKVLKHKIQQKNLSLLKPSNHPTNEEFDYVEHIKKMTKEEFGDYNNTSISHIPLPNDYSTSNPINISNIQSHAANGNIDYSPEAANSLTSNTNSIFSNTKYDHSLSISSQVSQKKSVQNNPQQNTSTFNLPQNHQHQQHQQSHPHDFNIEHFLDLDTKGTDMMVDINKNDSNFNEFDLLDLTKFDPLSQPDFDTQNNIDKNNFSLSNYINSLETAVKEDDKTSNHFQHTNFTTPIFNNQTTLNDTFTVPSNTNFNVTLNPKQHQINHSHKEQLSCNSCGTTTTPLWRKSTNEKNENLILCNACGLFLKLHGNLSKRNIGNKKIFNQPQLNNGINNKNDDHMGEIFVPSTRKPSIQHHQQHQHHQHQQQQQQQQQKQQQQQPLSEVVKEEDYDWLKFGL